MAHKVHPKAYRIRRIEDWDTRGYYKEPAESLEEDFKIREFLKKKIGSYGVEKVELERFPGRVNIIIFSSRPGLIIGRGGEEIEKIKTGLEKEIFQKGIVSILKSIIGKDKQVKKGEKRKYLASSGINEGNIKKEIRIEIREVRDVWASASLASQWVSQQIEKRVPFRRVLKQGLAKIMANKEVKGARIEVSGRLNGSDMSRREWVSQGQLPRQTIRAIIDYAKNEAHCTYGTIGVKVWIYKGERFD